MSLTALFVARPPEIKTRHSRFVLPFILPSVATELKFPPSDQWIELLIRRALSLIHYFFISLLLLLSLSFSPPLPLSILLVYCSLRVLLLFIIFKIYFFHFGINVFSILFSFLFSFFFFAFLSHVSFFFISFFLSFFLCFFLPSFFLSFFLSFCRPSAIFLHSFYFFLFSFELSFVFFSYFSLSCTLLYCKYLSFSMMNFYYNAQTGFSLLTLPSFSHLFLSFLLLVCLSFITFYIYIFPSFFLSLSSFPLFFAYFSSSFFFA
ncbi:unnamed protein product [Acanthosepion pharaonis]|uniref:Uncharacterized protein n=1 Tax=Acanthosepion pharaonis TaxID=158019 RepID=A0A812BUC2_ACAPH|nr:unnamed protein product [Sepia pharaonis]